MDPLSITAAVIGLVTAAGKITSLLFEFTSSAKEAPILARHVMGEIHAVNSIICSLQTFLWGEASKSREAMVKVEDLVVILTGCVFTFSELEKEIDGLKAGDPIDSTVDRVIMRMKWAQKEETISQLFERLKDHKSSLSLMLSILGR